MAGLWLQRDREFQRASGRFEASEFELDLSVERAVYGQLAGGLERASRQK